MAVCIIINEKVDDTVLAVSFVGTRMSHVGLSEHDNNLL